MMKKAKKKKNVLIRIFGRKANKITCHRSKENQQLHLC